MKKIAFLLFALALVAFLIFSHQKQGVSPTQAVSMPDTSEITPENLKRKREALREQLANELYEETGEQLKSQSAVQVDPDLYFEPVDKVEVDIIEIAQPDFSVDKEVGSDPDQ